MISRTRSGDITIGLLMFVALFLNLLISTPICAQVAGATLTGTVTDASGAVVPNAVVSIKNSATGITRNVTTDGDGFYSAPNLQPGSYEVTTSAPGFSTEVQTGAELTVGSPQVLNISIKLGQVTQTIRVTGEAPVVQLASSTISAEVNATTVRELPLNGRSWTDLANLQPGVNAIETQVRFSRGTTRGARGFGAPISISGAKPTQNNYRLDGISINDYSNGSPGSVLGGTLGVDAIQEFSVLSSNYSAEYGRTSGGVVNAISRSGTNQFHGSAYEFFRNSALDARNFFDFVLPPKRIPAFRRNQFGGSGGGPIRKDRTFIFADYEGIRQTKGVAQQITVPTALARTGKLSTKTVAVDPSAAKYLGLYPLPNLPVAPGSDTGQFAFPAPVVVNENFFTNRVDHKISNRDSIFATYVYDHTNYTTPDVLDAVLLANQTGRQVVVIEENHIFSPALVNTFRGGYSRTIASLLNQISPINPVAADTSLGSAPGQTASALTVTGLPNFTGGFGCGDHQTFANNSFQGYDDAFLTRGTHSLKFGGGVERLQLNLLALIDQCGTWTFSSLANFLTNRPLIFDSGFKDTLTARGLRQTIVGGYIQDDWRWRSNLTLNLGLRYEMSTVPTEVQGKLTNLLHLTDTSPHLGSPLFSNPTLHNFEPRLGFSWDPFHSGKTAVRGGFGMFDVLPLLYMFYVVERQQAPFYDLGQVQPVPADSFPTGGYALLAANPKSLRYSTIESHPHRSYVMQWNLNIQQELSPSLTATVAFVGNHGVHQQFRADDVDMVLPTKTPQGYEWPVPQGSGTKINPNLGRVFAVNWGANSFYDAMEVGLRKQMSHGVQIQGSFTWGKSIDNSSAGVASDTYDNSIANLPWYDLRLTKALSDFNIGRNLIINAIWQVPSPRLSSSIATWLRSGWQIGGVYKMNDGVPITPILAGDPLGTKDGAPFDVPDRLSGPGCSSLVNSSNANHYIKIQCFAFPNPVTRLGNSGRNIISGPGLSNLDFSLFKNNYIRRISENFNAQFRAEVFNVLNRANFEAPVSNNIIFDASGKPLSSAGVINSTVTDAREIQFALKLIW